MVIDAGHGGKDPGTIVGIAREKNIVLDIALKLGRLIKEQSPNIKVVYTRDGDYFIPLMDRPQIANKINADLFISIHANYCGSPEINGTETYVLGLHRTEDNLNVAKKENSVILLEDDYTTRYEGFNPNLSESYIMFELMQDNYLEQSLSFASILQSNFRNQARRRDREVRQAGFLVLRESSMPSVLIETGYLSNKKENAYLLTDAGRAEIAQSIYGSLINYLSKTEAKNNRTVKPVEPTNTEKVILKGKAI
ncbi:MAG: N-acetylmuramoyl-L-alanine amidase, partial [Marinilabiliales bacterium]|nr:N-acetylmuramoyl-L-alanine amidase [Marinilabiliales bacterium]